MSAPRQGPDRIATVAFVLIEGFPMMALAAAIEPLRAANRFLGREAYRWSLHSVEGGTVAASNGMAVPATLDLSALRGADLVFVCAGLVVDAPFHRSAATALRRAAHEGAGLGAISGGAFTLAAAGLLDGYRCTLHWEQRAAFLERFPHIDCSEAVFEIDRDRLTSAGGVTSMDLMIHLVAAEHGEELAAAIVSQFHIERLRSPQDPQRAARLRPRQAPASLVDASAELMRANIEEPLSTRGLSARLRVSPRRLERAFARDAGLSPGRFYRRLRLERARELLLYTRLGVLEVAVATGFRSSSYLAFCFREAFGRSPSALRRLRDTAAAPVPSSPAAPPSGPEDAAAGRGGPG